MSNNQTYDGWIVCPSKRFPGKFYYFNVLNGEAAWCLTDTERNLIGNEDSTVEKSHCYPEPESPPIIECHSGSMCWQHRKSNITDIGKKLTTKKITPVFGKVVFPKYVSNVDQCTPSNICREQNKIVPFCNKTKIYMVDQATQTFQSKRDICVQTADGFQCCFYKTNNKRENSFFISPPLIKQNKQLFNKNTPNCFLFQKKWDCNIPLQREKIKEPIMKNLTENNAASLKMLTKSNVNLFKPNLTTFAKSSDADKTVVNNFCTRIHESIKNCNPNNMSVTTNTFKTSKETPKTTSTDNSRLLHNTDTDKGINTKMSPGKVDLRDILNAKKRKNSADNDLSGHSEGKKIKTTVPIPKTNTIKKRVSFKEVDLDDRNTPDNWDNEKEENQEFSEDNGPEIPIMLKLKMSAKSTTNKDIWYIAIDTIVLLEELEFIEAFVQTDEKCRLLITRAVRSDIEAISSGDSCGRQRVYIARQIARKFMNPPPRFVLQSHVENNTGFDELSIDNILDCCLHVMNDKFHVVLVTNDTRLIAKANTVDVPCYKLQDIKDAVSEKQVITFDGNEITRTVNNNYTNNNSRVYSNNNSTGTPVNVYKKVFFADRYDSRTLTRLNDTGRQESNSDISEIGQDIKLLEIKETKQSNKTFKDIALDKEQNKFGIKSPFNTEKVKTFSSWPITTKGTQTTFSFQNDINNKSFNTNGTIEKNKCKFIIKKNLSQNKSSLNDLKNNDSINDRPLNFQNDIPNSSEIINHRLCDIDNTFLDKVSIEDHLRRFTIQNKATEDKIRSHLTEYLCSFGQIMENTLSDVLQNISPFSETPLTLLDVIDHIDQKYKMHTTLVSIIDKLRKVMTPYVNENGNFSTDVEPGDVMRMFGFGSLLMKNLKIIIPQCIELDEGEELLEEVLRNMEDPTPVRNLPYPIHHINRSDIEINRINYVKDPSLVIEYLKKHYPHFRSYEETNDNEKNQRELNSDGNDGLKVFRNPGINSDSLEVDQTKFINIVNAKSKDNKKANMEYISSKRVSVNYAKLDPRLKTKHDREKIKRVFKDIESEKIYNTADGEDNKTSSNTNETKPVENVKINNEMLINLKEKNTKELLNEIGLDYSDCSDKEICDNTDIDNRSDNMHVGNYDFDNQSLNKFDNNDKRKPTLELKSVTNCGRKPQETIKLQNREIDSEGNIDENTNDSGIDTECVQIYSLKKCFLRELAASFQIIYQFLKDSLEEICDEELVEERKLFFHDVFDQMLKHLGIVIDKLRRITDRESRDHTTLHVATMKDGFTASIDKRITNYRQVVKKCTEQALYLQNALKLTLAVTDISFERLSTVDSESISTSIQYINVFE